MSPTFIYGNWAAYDELSDDVPLDEALAMRQLDGLLRLRSQGVRFDGYLMDAFWFAKDGAYRTWRKPHWPDGPDRWLAACRENGLLPGLWFTANTLFHLDLPPAWADSIDAKGWGFCLFEGGFLAGFMEVLQFWYDRGVRIFKFDFAELGAVPKGKEGVYDAAESRERNIVAYRQALGAFRAKNRHAILMAYNGFEEKECMDRSDRVAGRYVDALWLETFDSMYCGDPRPSDLPCADFWRSVDIYSDCLARLYESSEIPLHRIDNCGFMAGPTGTCYWRGKEGWKEMLVLSLARGGAYHVAYGDLSLFDNEDAEFWAGAQRLYAPAMSAGNTRSFGGWPGAGEPYGWLSSGPDYMVATVVNPGLGDDVITLPDSSFENGQIRLSGGEVAVVTSGHAAPIAFEVSDLGVGSEPPVFTTIGRSPLSFPAPKAPGRYRIVVTQSDTQGNAWRNYPSELNSPPFSMGLRTSGDGFVSLRPKVDRRIWSGLSWVLVDFDLTDPASIIDVASVSPEGPTLAVEIYRLGS